MEEGNPISGVMLILVLVMINALVIIMKTAFENVNESSIKKRVDNGEQKAVSLLKLYHRYDKHVSMLELLLVCIAIGIGIGIRSFFKHITIDLPIFYVKNGLRVILSLLLIFITVLFGVVLPKKLAAKYAETLSLRTQGVIYLLSIILCPIVWLLDKSLILVLKGFGVKPSELEENVTEDEIISMVNEGQEQGVFDADDAEMISNIIELDEKEAQDIMTPKKRIVAINAEMELADALQFMLRESYSRYPLYESNRDNIIGIVHLKDVISAYISEDGKTKSLIELAREAYFVPDTQNIKILFQEMQSKNIHMAIVIDEYGQTAGLVALEDFIEEIVGNIQDEYDTEEKFVLSVENDSYLVRGAMNLAELEEEWGINIDHEDFDTLNGLLISILDRIPADGETAVLEYEGYRFEILETKNKMIEQVRITKKLDHIIDEVDTDLDIIEE